MVPCSLMTQVAKDFLRPFEVPISLSPCLRLMVIRFGLLMLARGGDKNCILFLLSSGEFFICAADFIGVVLRFMECVLRLSTSLGCSMPMSN